MSWKLTATVQGALKSSPAEISKSAGAPHPAFTPSTSPESTPAITVTPTIDRLAAPPTVENPTQADEGAQLFWLHCQPCHGDIGQGLTDEWREQYPEEDQNCWNSGCHGSRPYENGFTLPTYVPPVTGEESLERFETAGQLYGFISSAMPYQNPGYLTEEEYLAMTAFLARAHGAWDGTTLTAENAASFRLRPAEATATPEPTTSPVSPTEIQDNSQDGRTENNDTIIPFIVGLAAGIIGSLTIIVFLLKRRVK